MMSTRNIVVDVSPGTRGCVRLYFAREYVRYPLGNDPQYFTVCECDDDRNDGLMMAGSVAEPEDRTTGERRGSGMPLIPVPIKGGGGKNVFKTFEMAIRHNRRPTRTQIFLSLGLLSLCSVIFPWPSWCSIAPSPLDRTTSDGPWIIPSDC